ncbi:MAG TPA: phosphatidylserine decarboxylase family protein, partial [Thermoplasmatales archaeon]|nr:phosphatidylserine decarboxylase family protein [Thermoplasmatales archaeon]
VPGRGVVGCADGKIREIKKTHDEDIGDCLKISTFMNVYNVHVNRMPLNGVVSDIRHLPGGYVPAFKKESDRNERMILTLETEIGVVKIVQIAGIVARRIVPYIRKGESITKGERIGIIRFGSRVDLYLPASKTNIYVKENNLVKAGEDRIAEIRS